MRGASLVGYVRPVSSGTYRSAGSSSESFPSSRSLRMAIAVKLLVIEAMRNTVSAVTGCLVVRSREPATPRCANSPSMTMPQVAPGMCSRVVNSCIRRSMSGKRLAQLLPPRRIGEPRRLRLEHRRDRVRSRRVPPTWPPTCTAPKAHMAPTIARPARSERERSVRIRGLCLRAQTRRGIRTRTRADAQCRRPWPRSRRTQRL